VQLAGVARWVTFDNPTGIGGNPSGTVFGYGGNLTASINTFGDDSIKGQFAIGKAIATYINDCCFDLAPNAATPPAHATALPLIGWLIYYDHWWSKQWSSSIGFSQNIQQNSPASSAPAEPGLHASANLLWYPMQKRRWELKGCGASASTSMAPKVRTNAFSSALGSSSGLQASDRQARPACLRDHLHWISYGAA
jgi:hypothetical protein